MKIRTPNVRLSPATRDRWKKLVPAAAVFVVVALAAAFLYGRAGRTENVEVYALAPGVTVAAGDEFDGAFLRVVEIPADGTLLAGLVPASAGELPGVFTALRDLPAGAMLRNSDYVTGPAALEADVRVEDDNWISVAVPLDWGVSEGISAEVAIPVGNIWVVTDTLPPRHVACVQFGGAGASEALVHPKDLPPLRLWLEAGRAVAVQQTADECPLGGSPRLCGILTNAVDPADVLGDEDRAGGFVYVEELPDPDSDLADGEDAGGGSAGASQGVPVVALPECRVDDGAGVFDRPGDLTGDFCSKISLDYLARIGVEETRLGACGQAEGAERNPDDVISDPEDAEALVPDTDSEAGDEAGDDAGGDGADTADIDTAADTAAAGLPALP